MIHKTPQLSFSARRLGAVAAAVLALLLSLEIAVVAAARQQPDDCSWMWATADLSPYWGNIHYRVATSLPNQGLAIFAGGQSGV